MITSLFVLVGAFLTLTVHGKSRRASTTYHEAGSLTGPFDYSAVEQLLFTIPAD